MSPDEQNRTLHQDSLLYRAEGVTDAERYLKWLADRSFLSLWSYAGVYRDQGNGKTGEGKEVCDLLVVFEDHIVLFSDKDCDFPSSGDLELDWGRWYRRAVRDAAKQLWGAERWIKQFPNRLFLDKACVQPFPIELPDPSRAKTHRIVVAHDASRRCREHFGGSGSLILDSSLLGDSTSPFVVGQPDVTKGFVHVFDDTSLEIVMRTLDTISDLVAYLAKKERLFRSRTKVMATGEEELLALYLKNMNRQGEHDFMLPQHVDAVLIAEGEWNAFARNPQRQRQLAANEVSYMWDMLIEKFNHHFYTNTQYFTMDRDIKHHERLMRFMARECRTRRRMLATAIRELLTNTPPSYRAARVMAPSAKGDPFYVFVLLPHPSWASYSEYREVRRALLEAYCLVTKLNNPAALDIVGIATESGSTAQRSEDVLYYLSFARTNGHVLAAGA